LRDIEQEISSEFSDGRTAEPPRHEPAARNAGLEPRNTYALICYSDDQPDRENVVLH
jgi:hypothetical protein